MQFCAALRWETGRLQVRRWSTQSTPSKFIYGMPGPPSMRCARSWWLFLQGVGDCTPRPFDRVRQEMSQGGSSEIAADLYALHRNDVLTPTRMIRGC